MCSLSAFTSLPPEGEIALCEVHGQVHSMTPENADVLLFTHSVSSHPQVLVTREMVHNAIYRDDQKRIFVPVSETLLKTLTTVWFEQGFSEVLELLSQENRRVPYLLHITASCVLKAVDYITSIGAVFQPHLKVSKRNIMGAVSTTRDWERSLVRCLAWHPHCTKLAVAILDDSIRVYNSDMTSLTPTLKGKNQHNISSMAWRPFSMSDLAVGCSTGAFVWSVDPNSVATRPSISCATFLKQANHSPVTSVGWSPQGDLLMTSSAADATVYIWDVEKEKAVAIHKVVGGGVPLLVWSPDSLKVFTATMGTKFRVWETVKWTSVSWNTLGRVQSACWSPCGSVLLFATSQEPVIYSVLFNKLPSAFIEPNSEQMPCSAVPVIDLTPIQTDDTNMRIGGSVVSMEWDKKGHRLAVIFRDSPVVAVFSTRLSISLVVTPCCFINGNPGEIPNVICFQQNFDDGSMLSVAWSSGRVQHFPFIYSDLTEDRSFV